MSNVFGKHKITVAEAAEAVTKASRVYLERALELPIKPAASKVSLWGLFKPKSPVKSPLSSQAQLQVKLKKKP